MLRTGPWNRLALTIRWLKQEYVRDFPPELPPPMHMAIAYGLVKPKRVKGDNQNKQVDGKVDNPENEEEEDLRISQTGKYPRCAVCYKRIQVNLKNHLQCSKIHTVYEFYL